jgi:hypothetical protein
MNDRKTPCYIFHIPRFDKMFSYDELEERMKKRHPPEVVQVIDNQTKKRLGTLPAGMALIKFK